MIQELLGGSSVGIINGGGDRSKLSTTSSGGGGSPSPSPSPSHSSAENLRCPRCDSANTKFCYYNNYNLTQPRHFCKTCRRYWTKGGALRNVPIGGGCRKNKTTAITGKSAAKFKSAPPEMSKGLAEALSSNPIIWASSQNSHFLSLIRNNPTHLPIKDEASLFNSDPHYHSLANNNNNMPNPLYRNNQTLTQGILHGEAQNNHGLQELYHRLRLSSNCYPDHATLMPSPNSSAILESAPVAGAPEMGFWNSNISWPADLPTTNGAYP